MTADIEIRRAVPDDLGQVIGLLAQLAPEGSPAAPIRAATQHEMDVWTDILDQDRRTVLVAVSQGVVVGLADLVVLTSLLDGAVPHALLDGLIVERAFRGKGVGRSLIAATVAAAQDSGCCRLELLSSKERARAHAFYAAMGFEPTAEGFRRDLR